MSTEGQGEGTDERTALSQVQSSARGWHGVQLAVLGFIGLCGVVQGVGDAPGPRWLQVLAGLLVLCALVLQCTAVVLVATVAWPLTDRDARPEETGGAQRRLRSGVATTFLAVALLALATTASWWPRPDARADPALVRVETARTVVCGELRPSSSTELTLEVGGRAVTVAVPDVVRLEAVASCG